MTAFYIYSKEQLYSPISPHLTCAVGFGCIGLFVEDDRWGSVVISLVLRGPLQQDGAGQTRCSQRVNFCPGGGEMEVLRNLCLNRVYPQYEDIRSCNMNGASASGSDRRTLPSSLYFRPKKEKNNKVHELRKQNRYSVPESGFNFPGQ